MRILFAMSSPEYLRFYDDTLLELARRGHHVVIAVNAVNDAKPVRFEAVANAHPNIAVAGLVPARDDVWTEFARAVRGTMDFVRYTHPDLATAGVLRARMKRQALPASLQLVDRVRSMRPGRLTTLMRGLERVERAIPPAASLVRYLEEQRPDVVVVSPLIEAASDQVDLVKAAQACGIPTAAAIASWDNLTNKGDLRLAPGLTIVWNDAQKREAVEYHRVSPETVAVTGAQVFDRWFDRRPRRCREEFCRAVGLPANTPYVLYVGSSIFISRAESEMPFVRRWIEALRASREPAVRDLAVLVRPHPYNGSAWRADDFDGMDKVAVWPRGGYNPVDEGNREDFFDSIHHSAAVVGINTSAMIEAAIIGRPVLSVVTPEFARTQEGTLHFRHLLPENGGFLRVASTFADHVDQVASILRDPGSVRGEMERFVASFVRPHGVGRSCTPILAETIERHGATGRAAPVAPPAGSWALRLAAWPLARFGRRLLAAPSRQRHLDRNPTGRARAKRPAARVAFAVALPVVGATMLMLVLIGAELGGRAPLRYRAPQNVAEAAGMGLGAEVLRMMRGGADPTEVLPVGADVVSAEITRVTALEAAIWSRRVPLLRLLDRQGAIADADVRAFLGCLASDIRADDMAAYLGGNTGRCEPGLAVRQVQARTR